MKKNKDFMEKLCECRKGVSDSLSRWLAIKAGGCHDPQWPDGCNMNLVRNHMLYYKEKIKKICQEKDIPFPEEYYLPVPPKVDQNFMANLQQKERVKRLRAGGKHLVTKNVLFDETQLTFSL